MAFPFILKKYCGILAPGMINSGFPSILYTLQSLHFINYSVRYLITHAYHTDHTEFYKDIRKIKILPRTTWGKYSSSFQSLC